MDRRSRPRVRGYASRRYADASELGRAVRRPVARAFLAALIAACVVGTGVGALWQPRPAAAETIRELSWYLGAMHVDEAHDINDGDGVTVAVVDTGVDSGHPDLQGRVLDGVEVGDEKSPEPAGDGKDDTDGHGTGMASLIAGRGEGPNSVLGMAPKAKILPVRIAQNSDGAFRPQDVYDGVRWAIDHGAKVVNISLGGERTTDAPWKKQLVDYAISKDVVLIAAAGNTGQGDKRVAEPAAIPGVVAVSGVRKDGKFWNGSAKGPEVVVSAPAEGLPHAVPTSVSASGYALADGTSGATALVSGVAALIRSAFPEISANDVINRLIHTAEDRGTSGRDPEYGYGVVDARAALEGDVPGSRHHPLVSPKPEKSGDGVAAGAANRRTGNGALIVVSVFVGTVLLLLVMAYLLFLARRSRQVVVAGMVPGMGPVQMAGGAVWAPPGPGSTPGSGWPGTPGQPPYPGSLSPPAPAAQPPFDPQPPGPQPAPGPHPGPGPQPSWYPAPAQHTYPGQPAPWPYPPAQQPQAGVRHAVPPAPHGWPVGLPVSAPAGQAPSRAGTADSGSETQQMPIVTRAGPPPAPSGTPPPGAPPSPSGTPRPGQPGSQPGQPGAPPPVDPWARPPSGRHG